DLRRRGPRRVGHRDGRVLAVPRAVPFRPGEGVLRLGRRHPAPEEAPTRMNDTRTLDPTAELIGKIVAYRTSKCLYAVTALDIPALLQKGPASVEQLAEATGPRADLLDRIMSHLAAEGVFEARPDG